MAAAELIEREANRVVPEFVKKQGHIGVEVLPVSVWSPGRHRVRATFAEDAAEKRDLGVAGAGTGRWSAAAIRLAARLGKGRQVVVDENGEVVLDNEDERRRLVSEALMTPLAQTLVRLEPSDAPAVYVVDEPEAHLHPAALQSVSAWLGELARTAGHGRGHHHSTALLDCQTEVIHRVHVQRTEEGTPWHVWQDLTFRSESSHHRCLHEGVRFVVAWGDVPTWLAVAVATVGGGAALRQLKLQRDQLRDQETVIAAQTRQLERQQADAVDLGWRPGEEVQAAGTNLKYPPGSTIVVVSNNSHRPIRDIAARIRELNTDKVTEPHKVGRLWIDGRGVSASWTFEPVTGGNAPVLAGGSNHVGFLFDFDLHPNARKRATITVRFSDDADLHWQLDQELRLRKLDHRIPW